MDATPPPDRLPTRREIERNLSRIEMSADGKVLIGKILSATVTVGGKVIEIGRRIIAFVLDAMKRFPGITFGVSVGLTMSFLIGAVPVFGPVLSALLGPLLVAFGLALGALEDARNGAIYPSVERFGDEMAMMAQNGGR